LQLASQQGKKTLDSSLPGHKVHKKWIQNLNFHENSRKTSKSYVRIICFLKHGNFRARAQGNSGNVFKCFKME
jgi:hypothetical protein